MDGERKILTFSRLLIKDSTAQGNPSRVGERERVVCGSGYACVWTCARVYMYVCACTCVHTYTEERGEGRALRGPCQELSAAKEGALERGLRPHR